MTSQYGKPVSQIRYRFHRKSGFNSPNRQSTRRVQLSDNQAAVDSVAFVA